MPDERNDTAFRVRIENVHEGISEAEILLIESSLGDLVRNVLLMQDEEG